MAEQKLEIGCGDRPTIGYLHQDITQLSGVQLDFICMPWEINIPENTLTEVIAIGSMEHLGFNDFKKTVKHIYQILRPTGCFLFDVPNMTIWSEYLHNVTHEESSTNPFSDEHVWNTIYGWQRWPGDEHKSGWTAKSITNLMTIENFTVHISNKANEFKSRGISRRRFDRTDTDAHLYVCGIK